VGGHLVGVGSRAGPSRRRWPPGTARWSSRPRSASWRAHTPGVAVGLLTPRRSPARQTWGWSRNWTWWPVSWAMVKVRGHVGEGDRGAGVHRVEVLGRKVDAAARTVEGAIGSARRGYVPAGRQCPSPTVSCAGVYLRPVELNSRAQTSLSSVLRQVMNSPVVGPCARHGTGRLRRGRPARCPRAVGCVRTPATANTASKIAAARTWPASQAGSEVRARFSVGPE